jgi:hypothetical protein
MELGDFFSSGPNARPVNPRPVKFTCQAKGPILPGGTKNPAYPGAFLTECEAAFVFQAGDVTTEARLAARAALLKRCSDPATKMLTRSFDDLDLSGELTYHMVVEVLHQYDPQTQRLGPKFFPSVEVARSCLALREATRVLNDYDKYVDDEHPEVVDKATFREADAAGEGLAP